MSKKNTQSKQSEASSAGTDPVAAIQKIARAMPAVEVMTKTQISDLRSTERRAPAKFIALVLSEAEESDGSVAGVAIDPTTARSDVARATKLRVGAAAARSIARRLEQEALTLASGVAQRALSATTSLEAHARTPEGRSLVAKAAELRAAARKTKRAKAAAKTEAGPTPTPAPAEEPPPAPETAPTTQGPKA
jgi:hypothetical protein